MQTSRNRSERRPWWHACGRCLGRVARASLVLALLFAPALAANEPSLSNEAPASDEVVIPVGQEAVIPAGQEELLVEMLGRGVTLAECKLTSGEVDHAIIKATYACPEGEVVFELRHPDKAPANATRTARFAITLLSGSPPAGLADALTSRIRSRETAFEWKLLESGPERSSPALLLLAAAGILGLAVLGWALRRRRSARPTQLP
jgi:hypothetical protein